MNEPDDNELAHLLRRISTGKPLSMTEKLWCVSAIYYARDNNAIRSTRQAETVVNSWIASEAPHRT